MWGKNGPRGPVKRSLRIWLGVLLAAALCAGVFVLPKMLAALPKTATTAFGWNLMLVNRGSRIPKNYTVELTELSNGESVDARVYPALQEMFDAMRAGGLRPTVASGFRTREKQESLMAEKIAAYENEGLPKALAKKAAEEWVALPGASEHELGLAVDINAEDAQSEAMYAWLAQNAPEYGFIQRYPPNKTQITGTIHEPWHYRYVGPLAAKEMAQQGLCLEEYLALLAT